MKRQSTAPAELEPEKVHDLEKGHRAHLIDVRLPHEFQEWHAARAVNVPYLHSYGDPRHLISNPGFVDGVRKVCRDCRPAVLCCSNGGIAAAAALL